MDQRVSQQKKLFQNINTTPGMKAFISERSSIKLYIDNTNFQQSQNNLNIKLQQTDKTLQNDQNGIDSTINSPSSKPFINKNFSSRIASKRGGKGQLRISDLIQKKANTLSSHYEMSQQKHLSKDLQQQLPPFEQKQSKSNSFLGNLNENESNESYKQDNYLKFAYHLQSMKAQKGEQVQQQFQYQLSEQSSQNERLENKIPKKERNSIRTISACNNFLVGAQEVEKIKKENNQKEIINPSIKKQVVNQPLQPPLAQQNQQYQQKQLKRSATQRQSKGSFSIANTSVNGQIDLNNIQSQMLLQRKNEQKPDTAKLQERRSFKLNQEMNPLQNQITTEINEEFNNNSNKRNKGINSSFQSISSRSGGQDTFRIEKNGSQNQFNQQQQQTFFPASKSILGSTFTSSTNNSTPVGIYNPEQITQQLVKQNLMIFNRKELYSASHSRNSNTYTTSQRIIYQQNQNRNLYKQYQKQQQNPSNSIPSTPQHKYIQIESEKQTLSIKSQQLKAFIQNLDNDDMVNQATKLLLSKSILGNNSTNSKNNTDCRPSPTQLNLKKSQKNKNIIEEDIVISPLLQQQGNEKKRVLSNLDQEKQNFIKNLISKKNQKQIPLIDAPFFQNKIIQPEQQNAQIDQLKEALSPKSSKQKQFAYSMQINQQPQQNLLNKEMIQQQYSARSNYLPQEQTYQNSDPNQSKSQQFIQINDNYMEEQVGTDNNQFKNKENSLLQQPINSQLPNSNQYSVQSNKFVFPQRTKYQKQQQEQEIGLENCCNKGTSPLISPCELFLQKMSPRPKTGIPYQKKKIPQNTHQQFLSKLLLNERNEVYERIKGSKDTQDVDTQQQNKEFNVPHNLIHNNNQNNQQQNINNFNKKQKSTKNEANNTAQQHFSPWQNSNNTSGQYQEDDSLDFIQYTISS